MTTYYAPETAACRPFEYDGKIWLWTHWTRGVRYGEGLSYSEELTASHWVLRAYNLADGTEVGDALTVRMDRYAPLDQYHIVLTLDDIEWQQLFQRANVIEPHVLCGSYSVLSLAYEGELIGVNLATREVAWRHKRRNPYSPTNRVYWPIMYVDGLVCCGFRESTRSIDDVDRYQYEFAWGDDDPVDTIEVSRHVASRCGLVWIDPATGAELFWWDVSETGQLWREPVGGGAYLYTSTSASSVYDEFLDKHVIDCSLGPYPPAEYDGKTLQRFSLRYTHNGSDYECQGITWTDVETWQPYWTYYGTLGSVKWYKDGILMTGPGANRVGQMLGDSAFSATLSWRAFYGGSDDRGYLTDGKTSHALTNGCLIELADVDGIPRTGIVLGPLSLSTVITGNPEDGILDPLHHVWRAVLHPIEAKDSEDHVLPATLWTRTIERQGSHWGRRASAPISVGAHIYTIIQETRNHPWPTPADYGDVRMIVLLASDGSIVADDVIASEKTFLYHELMSDGVNVYARIDTTLIAYPCKPQP